MGLSPNILGPSARASYDRQKSAAPAPLQSAVISARVRKGQHEAGRDAAHFIELCATAGLPAPQTEFMFHPERKWRMDFAWPAHRLALERDGGVFIPGGAGHNTGAGVRKDHEKGNSAAVMGWRILHVFPEKLLKTDL